MSNTNTKCLSLRPLLLFAQRYHLVKMNSSMKKFITLLLLLVVGAAAFAQTCVRDSSIITDSLFIKPKQWTPADPTIYTAPACIGEAYNQSITFNIPDMITFGGFTLPLSKVTVAPTGAITGMPAGLAYTCDPPNCEFSANSLGCMLISGAPAATVAAGDYEVSIQITAFSLITQTLNFPADLAPTEKYFISIRNAGQCASSTNDLSDYIFDVKNAPNPFAQLTQMNLDVLVAGQYQFEVFNLLGKKVHDQALDLTTGLNQFTFDAGDLPNGTYFYTIGNGQGRMSSTFVINR